MKPHPFSVVHEVQALHKLVLGEVALITSNCCPHIFEGALGQTPLHECPKAITTLHNDNITMILNFMNLVSWRPEHAVSAHTVLS